METRKQLTGYPSIDRLHQKGIKYFERHPFIPSISLYDLFFLMTKKMQNEYAVDCNELHVTYKELKDDIKLCANGFSGLGIKQGDIIVIQIPNIYQGIVSFFAANMVGATVTFLNAFAEKDEVLFYLQKYNSPLFINFDVSREDNQWYLDNTRLNHIVTIKKEEVDKRPFSKIKTHKNDATEVLCFTDLGNMSIKARHIPFNGKGNALILYTSGTTGKPKAVVLTNKNIIAAAIYQKNSTHLKTEKGEKCFVCVPYTYPYGFVTSVLMTLLCGREAILCPDLSKDNIGQYMSKGPNMVFGSPALLELIMRNIPEDMDLSFLKTFITGGDFLSPSQEKSAKIFFRKHNSKAEICNGSGNAETCGSSTTTYGFKPVPGTVGVVLYGSDPIIIDENEKELPYGKEGQLCIAGEHVFKEYYGEPELTQQAILIYKGKRYLKTGSMGVLHENGYFSLTNRASRFYIISTLNKVYCDYVQNAMSAIDIIDSIAVVKKPDKELLFHGKAYVVLKKGIPATEETKQIIFEQSKHILTMPESKEEIQLKSYEIPKEIEFVDALPRTKADKVDYKLLEELN